MPTGDRRIGPATESEDVWGIMGANTGQRTRLIGHPLSLQPIRESSASALPDLCPSPEPDTNGRRALVLVSLHLSVEWDGMRERTCF